MRKINFVKLLAVIFLVLSVFGILASYIIDVDFVEKNIDKDGRIGEHVKTRITAFQSQAFSISLSIGILGILMLVFRKILNRWFKNNKGLLLNILLLIFIILFILIIGEVVLRVFLSDQIYSEYGYGPGSVKFLDSLEYNSFGFRDIGHNIQKEEGIFRIIAIGDSYTYGAGIDNIEDTYPKLLQSKLGSKYEVMTLAKGGYSTIDELKLLNEIGLGLNPDLIILGYHLNDAEGPGSRIGFEKMFYHHYVRPFELGNFLYTRSFMYYFLESRIKNLIRSKNLNELSYEDYVTHLYSDSNPFFEEHEGYLSNFISIAKENDIPVIIINAPTITNFNPYPFYYVNDYIEKIALSNGATYIDLLPHFSEYNPEDLRVSFMDSHLNELANDITSKVLFNHISNTTIQNVK